MSSSVFLLDYDVISPLGCGKEELYTSLKENLRAEGPIDGFDSTGLPLNIAAEVKCESRSILGNCDHFTESVIIPNRRLELLLMAYGIMKERLCAFFDLEAEEKRGVIIGIGADVTPYESLKDGLEQNISSDDPYFETILEKNQEINSRFFQPYDLGAVYLAEELGLWAFQRTILTACASSIQSVILGCEAIKQGEAEIVLAGGADSIINDLAMCSFNKLGVLAEPEPDGRSCKPFDIDRKGTLAGEASGLCVLASEDFTKKHGIDPAFQILSYGNTLDAYQITSPDPEGKGIKRALVEAVRPAPIVPSDIGYINLHGTGTRLNDLVELESLREVFGEDLAGIPISSTKDRHGHAIAAAGIQELSVLCTALEKSIIPCNLNLRKPIVESGFDLVMDDNRERDVVTGMTCNYSFGGVNSILIIQRLRR